MERMRTMWKACPSAAAVIAVLGLVVWCGVAGGAAAVEESSAGGARERVGGAPAQRIVVDPEPWWPRDGEWSDWDYSGAPRISVWVDRGEWATYEPGDRIAVYFRVDRPCHVTVLDYTTTGEVEVLFPSAWSGSGYVEPHRIYRIPDSGRYSLRVTGPSGVETIVAYAHDAAWPSGWVTPWMFGQWAPGRPPLMPDRSGHDGRVTVDSEPSRSQGGHGTVVVEPSRPSQPQDRHGAVVVEPSRPHGRGRGRVVVEPRWWPVPSGWSEHRERWSCDDVSFYVADSWSGSRAPWPGSWDSWDRGRGVWEQFEMWRCDETFERQVAGRDGAVTVAIRCTDSADGRAVRIVGRVVSDDGWDDETLFRLDADGRRGDVPRRGLVYETRVSGVSVEIEVLDVEMSGNERNARRRIEWIRFDVRASAD